MKRRVKPTAKPSRVIPVILGAAIVIVGFATLMIRLKVIQEGYRLSALRADMQKLAQENQRLRLEEAELSSYQRLRTLAPKYGLRPPAAGQIIIMH